MNNTYLMQQLNTENILDYADYLSHLPAERFIERFRPVAPQYQQEIKNASRTYRLALAICLSHQQAPLNLQRNRYETLARKIEQATKLIRLEALRAL